MAIQRLSELSLFVLTLAVGACSAAEQPVVPLASPNVPTVACEQAYLRVDQGVPQVRDTQVLEECPSGPQREIALAEAHTQLGDRRRGREMLNAVRTTDRGVESKRNFLLYVYSKTDGDLQAMSELAKTAQTSYSDLPFGKLTIGIDACVHARCASALRDLEEGTAAVRNRLGLGYLMVAYADASRLEEAQNVLDHFHAEVRADGFDNMQMYVAVYLYLRSGRADEAKNLYSDWISAYPAFKSSEYALLAKALIDQHRPRSSESAI